MGQVFLTGQSSFAEKDFKFQSAEVQGQTISVSRFGPSQRLFFKLEEEIMGSPAILLNNSNPRPLLDGAGNAFEGLAPGYYEVVEQHSFFVLVYSKALEIGPVYGVQIDELNPNPETSVTYTDAAEGFAPMQGNNGNFSWGDWEDVFEELGIKPCLFKNGVRQFYLNPDNFAEKEDGSAADITSGAEGDVMIEFPRLYWRIWRSGNFLNVQFSRRYFDKSVCPAHTVGSEVRDSIYLSAFLGNLLSDKVRSLSGKLPSSSVVHYIYRQKAMANGAGYHQATYYSLVMLQVLFLVFFKSMNSESLGKGFTATSNTAKVNTGGTVAKGMFFGELSGQQQMKFCGIEDVYGNSFYSIDGINIDIQGNLLIGNQLFFTDSSANYLNKGLLYPSNQQGFISKVLGDSEAAFCIQESLGSETQYYCDSAVMQKSPETIRNSTGYFGGLYNVGDSSGIFRFSIATQNTTAGNPNIGVRLTYL